MSFAVKSEANFEGPSFGNSYYPLGIGLLVKELKTRSSLFEFILDILSNPRFSSIMSWEGTTGQFVITEPNQAARLWGERNGRRNMTYQKFSRALRYYYHKKVLTKIRGQKYTYKFNLRELERQYGYVGISLPAINESVYQADYAIFAPSARDANVYPNGSPMVMSTSHESQDMPFGSFSGSQFYPFFFEF